MHLHIAGIGGTFMAGVALLARALGHKVTGSDQGLYPPMSTQLAEQGIDVRNGYEPAHLTPTPDVVVIGNALSRGNPLVEAVLDRDIPYVSGAQWVAEHVLQHRWVLAVAGTHGKTTTSSMLAWILEYAGLRPGFLIGGVPANFGVSARFTDSRYFVIEADEYDTAFFDKRSKFVHYRPRTAVLNNLEYDHADIFPDLDAIKRQFHHLVRIVPASGRLIVNANDGNIADTLRLGCWSPVERFGAGSDWSATLLAADGSHFRVHAHGRDVGDVRWSLYGEHNVENALAALAAAHHAGVPIERGLAALTAFRNARRRLELRGEAKGISVYDDFAHHPTAIRVTLAALRARIGNGRLIAALEPRSNTMKLGVHRDTLAESLAGADRVALLRPTGLSWDIGEVASALGNRGAVYDNTNDLLEALVTELKPGDHVLLMSNGSFDNLHLRLLERLRG
ncbi:MAG: UDP-N-acetylmuramate:L-alanyl-gamma-D-glutamyl-meso-diaminopimelate ligase [Gammaproteobacteria bacterium]|nr:UDP-N-acetylmuramate:L-alanyl-gamma-D-glutamyl-meso-diaminopimelate ligase [Gammaproteobacteria bacterium]